MTTNIAVSNLNNKRAKMQLLRGRKVIQQLKPIFNERIIHGFHRFCDDTNITGFKELYYAKSYFFKLVWLILILFGACFTVYQCWYSINEYLAEPTNTVIQQLRETPQYPPLKLCYSHWIFWIDWKKFLNLNLGLDRDSFIYAMSFAKTIFIATPMVNYTLAKDNFETMMREHNYETLISFYLSIARDVPIDIKWADMQKTNFTVNFHDYYGSELCYVKPIVYEKTISDKRTIGRISERGEVIKLSFDFNYKINIGFITDLEENYYRRAAYTYQSTNDTAGKLNLLGNETSIYISPMIYADGTDDMVMPDPSYFQYLLKLNGNVYKWKSTDEYPCTNNKGIDFGGKMVRNCQRICELKLKLNSSSCIDFAEANMMNILKGICNNDIVLANLQLNQTVTLYSSKKNRKREQVMDTLNDENFDYFQCIADCIRPCEQWIYETSTVTNLRPYQFRDHLPSTTDIEIHYPSQDTIVVMMETPSTTWQKMLSDIGGLLGLWLGATLLSFLQIIYLCCCADLDEFCSTNRFKSKINVEDSIRITQLRVDLDSAPSRHF